MNAAYPSTTLQGNASEEHDSLRSKVVEILSSTANGCLTELGYFPRMPQRLQELERQNTKWQQENVKLFQDNQSLTRALQERKDPQQTKPIQALQHQIQSLTQENSTLKQQMQSLLAAQPAAYHQLLSEYHRFQDFYQKALQEIGTLRQTNALLSGRPPPQSPVTVGPGFFKQITQPQPQPQNPPRSSGSFSGVSSNALAHPSVPVPSQMIGQQGRQFVDQSQIRHQPVDLVQTQESIALGSRWNRQQHNPDAEANLPRSISRVPNRSRPVSRPVSSTNTPRPTPPHLSIGTTVAVGDGNLNMQDGISHPPTPMSAPLPQRQSYLPPEASSSTYQPRTSAVGPSTASRTQSLPSSPAYALEPSSFVQTSPAPLALSWSNAPTILQPAEAATPLKATMNDQSRITEAPTAEKLTPVPLPVNAPQHESSESASPAEPFEAITPMSVTVDDPPTISVVASPPTESLKRPSISLPDIEGLSSRKKPRLEAQEGADGIPGASPPVVESPMAMETQDDEEGDEESDDEEIRVGPDGLRLVEDCLPALIQDDEQTEGLKTCRLCAARVELGYSTIEIKPFINASVEELVQHCSSEHQSAWETLRRV